MKTLFDAFISYGRADSKAFATKLHGRLLEEGLNIWFDQNDIPLGVDYQNQIDEGIDKAHNFLFIIAPHSVNSPYCGKEIDLAIKRRKRIIPLLHVEQISWETWQQRNPNSTVEDWEAYQAKGKHTSYQNMHPTISKINWVYFREEQDDFEVGFAGLISLIRRQADYVEQHTRFLAKALEWERHQKQNSYLLIGEERQEAKSWLKIRFKDDQPPCVPTDLHCEFISESKKNANNLMTQVFISYSTQDKEFMLKISKTLMREGFTIWTNKTDIKSGLEFQEEINKGIEGADNVVYLISPDSLQSGYCQQEIAHTFANNKRLITLLVEPTELDDIPPNIRALQFIDFTTHRDEVKYKKDADKLLKLLNQDIHYYEQHKVLLVKALKWISQNRNPSILLRGYNLKQAEAWLKVGKHRTAHPPLPWHKEFITESAKQPEEISLEAFISYSRADSDFARKLNDALQIQGKTTWFDQESIASGTDFQQEIYGGIENSDNFLFIISPKSVNSPYCADEVEYAQKLNKRFVTILHREVSAKDLHPELAKVQWIDFNKYGGDFSANFSELIGTLDTDREYVKRHTKWLQRAIEWEKADKNSDLLLRGREFASAQNWLQEAEQNKKQPTPTDLQKDFILECGEALAAELKREKFRVVILRSLLGLMSVGFVVSVGIGMVAFKQYQKTKSLVEDQINAQIRYSNLRRDSHQEFDALIEGIKGGKLRKQLGQIKPETKTRLIEALERVIQGVTELNRLEGHQGKVNSLDFSPNHQMIATASKDKTVKLWSWNGKELKTLQHDDEVSIVKFSPNSQIVATASKDKTVKLWSVDGNQLKTMRPNYLVEGVSFSPDSQMIVSYGQDNTAQLWSRDAQKPRRLRHKGDVYGVSFSPDGKMIATRSQDKTAKLWSLDGKELKTLHHADEVYGLVFSPDGKMIATASKDKTAKLWNLDGKELKTLHHAEAVNGLVFSPDGKMIVTYSKDKTAKLWSLDGKELKTLRHTDEVYGVFFSPNGEELQTLWHDDEVWDGSFSPDGKTIATRSKDKSVQLWSRSSQYFQTLQRHHEQINDVSFSPDGKTIATASADNTVKLWSLDGKELKTLSGHKNQVRTVSFSPDGKTIATRSNDKTVKLWSLDGKEIKTLKNQFSVYFSPDGKMIATVSNRTVTLWSLKGEQLKVINAHAQDINDLGFSPDGKIIATASEDKTVKLWSREGYRIRTLTGYQEQVINVNFSSDGKTIGTASADKTAKLWSFDGKLLHTLTGHQDQVNLILFSPDGKTIATRSKDNTVKLWSPDGKQIGTLSHDEKIKSVRFSSDSKMIATASEDKTVKIWSRDGKSLETLWHDKGVSRISFSPDSKMIATVSNQNFLTVWNLDLDKLYKFADRDLYLNDLMTHACDQVRNYLNHKPAKDSDRHLCDGIGTHK